MNILKLILPIALFCFSFKLYAPDIANTNDIIKIIKVIDKIELELFLEKLAFEETKDSTYYPYKGFNNPWIIVNSVGAMGRWQLMDCALKDIGYKGTTRQFLNSRKIQKECVIRLLERNKQILAYNNLTKYIGKTIRGVKITLSGMLAASHLGGVGGVKNFILTGDNATDGNATIKGYLHKFENFNI